MVSNCIYILIQWQDAYDKLAEYVWKEEPSTLTYYFGIPYDHEHDIESTPLMFAFEVYPDRKVNQPPVTGRRPPSS